MKRRRAGTPTPLSLRSGETRRTQKRSSGLERFARAAHTVFAMKREKIGLIGGCYYDVMPASNWHPDTLTGKLGPSYVEADISLLEEACDRVAPGQVTASCADSRLLA